MVVAGAHHCPTVDGRGGEGHLVGGDVAVVGVVAVELTAAVAHCVGHVLDGEPVRVVLSTVALVPVEAVVATEGHERIGDGNGASEELDAVVQVGDHFDVVEHRGGTDATEGEAVDLVGRTELGAAMADGAVRHDAGVVGVVGSSVNRLVVVRRDALNLGGPTEVGGGVTEDDHTSPLAAGVIGDGTVERVGFVREDDGRCFRSIGENLSAFGDDEGGGVRSASRGTLDDGASFNGQDLSCAHEDVAVEDVGVVGCPGGAAGAAGDLDRVLRHGPDGEAEHDKQRENCSHGLVDWLTCWWNSPSQNCSPHLARPLNGFY